ncbi:hypothetical protein BD309DRAFT_1084179 [Dichomitus squalens]|nr:hypothetical protein BD309DRAFT_1084179 [Dichomitus squalens]
MWASSSFSASHKPLCLVSVHSAPPVAKTSSAPTNAVKFATTTAFFDITTHSPTQSSAGPDKDGATNVRNVPVRIYLPDGPVLPPILEDGTMHVLSTFLTARLSLLFPEPSSGKPNLGYALIQGVPAPPDTEMAWLGACMAGADGWVNVCVGLLRESA